MRRGSALGWIVRHNGLIAIKQIRWWSQRGYRQFLVDLWLRYSYLFGVSLFGGRTGFLKYYESTPFPQWYMENLASVFANHQLYV